MFGKCYLNLKIYSQSIVHQEIKDIIQIKEAHNARGSFIRSIQHSLIEVNFFLGEQNWILLVDDEYGDYDEVNQSMCLFLVLRALEEYSDAEDFLTWSRYYHIDSSEPFYLEYYRDMAYKFNQITAIIGEPNSFISSLDYELRAGAFASLMKGDASFL